MGVTKKQTEEVAELLADQIIHKGEVTQDETQCLIAAINAMYGSLEMFYEDFYQYLDSVSLAEFGQLVDQAVQQKKKSRENFAAIINSEMFQKIVRNFSKVRTSIAGEANHAAPILPHGTAIPYKKPSKGKSEKER